MRPSRARVPMAALLALLATQVAAEPLQLRVDGQARTALLEKPAGPGPHPTIIMLHGGGLDPVQELQQMGLARLAREGFLIALPEGRGRRWNFFPPGEVTRQDRELFERAGGVPDDLAFIRGLAADLVGRGLADPARLFLAGHSLGGVMALRLVCVDARPFAGLALLMAAMAEVVGAGCRPGKPLPVLMLNATGDPVLPYAGGRSRRGDPLWPAERLVAFLRDLNGCRVAPERAPLAGRHAPPVEVERSTACAGAPVVFYRAVGGGHAVPAGIDPAGLLLDLFAVGRPAATAAAPAPAPKACTRFETRLFADLCNGCSRPPYGQTIVKGAGAEWTVDYVDGTRTRRRSKYREVSASASEILLHDAGRDIHARLDLAGRKGFVRRGAGGDWVPILDLLSADCF